MGFRFWCLVTTAVGLFAVAAARPAKSGDDGETGPPPSSFVSLPFYLRQITDSGGLRTALEQQGVNFTFSYYGDALANPIGGVERGFGYDGRFGVIIDADLAKLFGWNGASFHASIHQINGTQFGATHLDNLMTVSSVEALPTTRLFNLWIEQAFTPAVNLRVGQITAAQEFEVSQHANLFVNATFGWPMLNSVDLPSGGADYPEATPGARLAISAGPQFTLRAAVLDGNPAGPGTGDPVDRDPYGLAFRINDPPFFIAELEFARGETIGAADVNPNEEGNGAEAANGRATPGSSLPGAVKIGAWGLTGAFANPQFGAQGAAPIVVFGAPPPQYWGNYGVYGAVDQTLWRVPGSAERGLGVFLRATTAPSDRNLIDLYADGGVTFKGPIAARPDDTIGLAFAVGRVSPAVAAYDRDLAAASGEPVPVRDFEAAIEWTYRWKLAERWFIQPDLQYIFHPGGNIAPPPGIAGTPITNALVVALRTTLRF
jgi:porin